MEENTNPFDVTAKSQGPLEMPSPFRGIQEIEYYSPPRLGIIHLLGWVTFAAILMKFNVAMDSLRISSSNETKAFQIIQQILMSCNWILMASTLVGGVVLFNDRIRRKAYRPLQPGHWIIAINSASMLFSLPIWAGFCIFQNNASGGSFPSLAYRCYLILNGILYFAITIAYFWAARHLPERGRWRWIMIYCMVEEAIGSLFVIFSSIFIESIVYRGIDVQFCAYPLLALLFAAMSFDFIKRVPRDWLHWLGGVTPLMNVILSICWQILIHYLQDTMNAN